MLRLLFAFCTCLSLLGFAQTEKAITINEVFWPVAGYAIESEDAFPLSRWGVIETLLQVDYDGTIVPMLASAWQQSSPTTWEFTLREDVRFHNGQPFNAAAVVTAFNYLLDSDTPLRSFSRDSIVSIEATGDFSVTITTKEEDVLLANRFVNPHTAILAPEAYESSPSSPFGTGTGPFILESDVPEQSVSLVKNPDYWRGEVALDAVTVLSTPDAAMRALMLQTGEVDISVHLPIPMLPILQADNALHIVQASQPRTGTMYLNNASGILADVAMRRAVLAAIDKAPLVTAVLEDVGQPAVGPFAPNEGWVNRELNSDSYQPEHARAILAEAGYDDDNKPSIRIWTYPARADLPTTAIVIQDMLNNVGFNAEVRIANYGVLEADVLEGDFDIFIVSRGHLLDTYDPEGFLSADFSCGGGYNLNHYCNETVDNLLAEARAEADSDKRFDIYRHIQRIVVEEEVASIFLYHTVQNFGHREGIVNYKPHLLEYYLLTPELDIAR